MKPCTILLFATLMTTTGPAAAANFSPEVEREASKVTGELMSPYCPGKLIADCPSPAAIDLRHSIRQRIAAGETAETIRDELYAEYGEYLRASPRGEGFDLVAWVVPFLAVGLGGLGIVAWIRRRRRDEDVLPAPSVSDRNSESRARIQAELDKLD